jgi:DNA/RNA endonuclease YhcR with UshA esterase domain
VDVGLVLLVVLMFTSPRHRAPAYKPWNEVTVQGTVEDVQEFYCPISGDEGTHLLVKTENGSVQVHLAPTRFLRDKNLSFSKGDVIQVVGSRIIYQGRDALIARTVVRGSPTMAFREQNGKPVSSE